MIEADALLLQLQDLRAHSRREARGRPRPCATSPHNPPTGMPEA
jgi:hypothetical protein